MCASWAITTCADVARCGALACQIPDTDSEAEAVEVAMCVSSEGEGDDTGSEFEGGASSTEEEIDDSQPTRKTLATRPSQVGDTTRGRDLGRLRRSVVTHQRRTTLQMPWQIRGQQPWAPSHPNADLFSRVETLAVTMKDGKERDEAVHKLLSMLPKAVSTEYLNLKLNDARYGFMVYRGALRHVSGEELEAAAMRLDGKSLWYQKGKDKNFFTGQGK